MKKLLSIFIGAIISAVMILYAQSPQVISLPEKSNEECVTYDSLRNLRQYINLRLNFKDLVGQEIIFLKNKYWANEDLLPIAIYTELPNDVLPDSNIIYFPSAGKNIYEFYTLYIGLAGKTFRVKDFLPPHSNNNSVNGYLVLEGPPIHPNLYLECIPNVSLLPCVIKGYDKKLRDSYISQKFIPIHPFYANAMADNSPRKFESRDTLYCVDAAYTDDKNFKEILFLKDSTDNLYYADKSSVDMWCNNYNKLKEQESIKRAKQIAREQEMCKIYGKSVGKVIARGSVKIGFTTEQCIDAWGDPESINTTTTRYGVEEQWVYGNQFLYFKNGKLSAIQDL